MGNNDNPRWYHIIAFALLLLLAGYVITSCGSLLTRTVNADDTVDIHFLINQYRQSQGLAPFLVDARLMTASEVHNRWMRDNNCFAHQCPGEADPWQRIRDAGYPSPASEVIGRGYGDAASVLDGWKHSAGHNAILLGNWRDMGCHALREGVGGPWWTCDFATGGSSLPVPTPTPTPRLVPVPTPTPPAARGGLPLGYVMEVTGRFSVFGLPRPAGCPQLAGTDCLLTLQVDYDRSDWSVTDYLFNAYCWREDATCRWLRKGQ